MPEEIRLIWFGFDEDLQTHCAEYSDGSYERIPLYPEEWFWITACKEVRARI